MACLWDWMPRRRAAILGMEARVDWAALGTQSALGGRLEELRGRSVSIAVRDPLLAALAMVELDGVASRMVLCTPDLSKAHLLDVATMASTDAWIVDADPDSTGPSASAARLTVPASPSLVPLTAPRRATQATEWILLTSGTAGVPKLVVHSLESLAGGLPRRQTEARTTVWSTFYDIRRYGGLQILLRALVSDADMVLSSSDEAIADFLDRAAEAGVTHISGTPSHWRRVLMSGRANRIAPAYVRLSGEIANQALLDRLASTYPGAGVAHAFASTEAGVAFAVEDGQAGFPAYLLDRRGGGVDMKVENGTLRIRSARLARCYLGEGTAPIADAQGYADTGDRIETSAGRCHFLGREGGVINVGGLKVHPEEVEAVLNADARVRMSLVRARKNPIVGAIVVAEVVLADGAAEGGLREAESASLRRELIDACRAALPPHKVPALLHFVPALSVSAAGKLVRHRD